MDLSNLDLAGTTLPIAIGQWFVHSSPCYVRYESTEIVTAAAFVPEAAFEDMRARTWWSRAQCRADQHAARAAPAIRIAAPARYARARRRCALI